MYLNASDIKKTKLESVQLGLLLKKSLFIIEKRGATKNGKEFRQQSIAAIRCSLATLCNFVRRCSTFYQLEVFIGEWVAGG